MADGSALALKVCRKCDQQKPLASFKFYKSRGRHEHTCNACEYARAKLRRLNRTEDQLTREREWRRAYDDKNREKRKENQRRWQVENREKCRAISRKWHRENHDYLLWNGLVNRARKKGLAVTLTREWIKQRLDKGVCELTGLPFSRDVVGRCGPFGASIDRIDSSLGYTPQNCRMICWALNMGLSEWGEEVYVQVAKAYLEREPHHG